MADVVDLDKRVSQSRFGAMVGITQQRVQQLLNAGVLRRGDTLRNWLLAYSESMRETAAGRATNGDLDLAQERAALAREQRVSYEIKNAVARGDFAPVSLLADVLATASQAVVDRFATLDGRLKKMCPHLSGEDRAQVQGVIASACREWARETGEMVDKRLILKHASEVEA